MFPSAREDAFHGHFELSQLLKVSLCFQGGVPRTFELQQLPCRILCLESDRSDRSDGPLHVRVAQVFGLIPVGVAGEGVQVGGSIEQKEEELGTPKSDMSCGWCVSENARRMIRLNTVHQHIETHARMCI